MTPTTDVSLQKVLARYAVPRRGRAISNLLTSVAAYLGLIGSLGLMRLLHSQLFGIATVDPAVLVAAAALFLLTTSVAVALPTYRAATTEYNELPD